MRYLSVCSGIEAATVAWHPLGWTPAAFSEIEAFPRAVLAHHYPNVPNLGDMTKIAALVRAGAVAAPDVLVGGTPCQAFSIAGLRNSLGDARGQLTLSFVDLANAIDTARSVRGLPAATIVWENVPGVLSTADNAFGCFLGALAGEDSPLVPAGGKWPNAGCVFGPQRAIAWRVLDAQFFGVAQRRRRVFVVASARKGFDPTAVLFESEGVRRDSPPSRSTGENVAGTLSTRTTGGGGLGTDFECAGGLQPVAGTLNAGGHSRNPLDETLLPIAFDSRQDCVSSINVFGALGSSSPQAQALCIHADTIGRTGEAITPSADAEGRVRLRNPGMGVIDDGTSYNLMASGQPHAVCVTGQVTHTLTAEGHDASEDGTGRGQPIVTAHAFDARQSDVIQYGDFTGPLDTCGFTIGVQQSMAVRRLTPRECERLQGFPDVIDQLTITICKNEEEKTALAKSVAPGSAAPNLVQSAPVAAHVLIDYGQQLLQLRSAGRLIWSANIADRSEKSHLRMPTVDFVRLIALTKPCLVKGMPGGREASPANTSSSMAPSSGSAHVLLCGREIVALASDAEAFTAVLNQCTKSTTSHLGHGSQHYGLILETLSSCAAAAISGCIPKEIQNENFSLVIEVVTPYTLVPVRGKPAADGPRYKALGNSMAVPVMAWIGRRIQAVEEITREERAAA